MEISGRYLIFLAASLISAGQSQALPKDGMAAIFEANKRASEDIPDGLFTRNNEIAADDHDDDDEADFGIDEEEDVKLFEGDIVYTKDIERVVKGETSFFDALANKQWYQRTVPYTIDSRHWSELVQPIEAAVRKFNEQLGSCIKWIRYDNVDAIKNAGYRNYVMFISAGGCYSNVGMMGGEQKISLGQGCRQLGTVIHEMVHALGFFHEQSRDDRDQHIKIFWENIMRNMGFNFKKMETDKLGHPYDIDSVMHYPPYAFSKDGRKTIEHIGYPKRTNFGYAQQLSKIDVAQLLKYYTCPNVGPEPTDIPVVVVKPKVDGGWSAWGHFGHCSKSCGAGTRTRTRYCNNPVPQNRGAECQGEATDTHSCNTAACPQPEPADCVDRSWWCRRWSRRGECERQPVWMKQTCCKSCRRRTGGGDRRRNCFDHIRRCRWIRNYCNVDVFASYMRDNCARTCNKC